MSRGDRKISVLVDLSHLAAFMLPVPYIVLQYTEAIDPHVINAQSVCEYDGIPKCLWHFCPWNLVPEALKVLFGGGKRLWVSPPVTEAIIAYRLRFDIRQVSCSYKTHVVDPGNL